MPLRLAASRLSQPLAISSSVAAKASDASNSGKDFSFGSDEVPPEVKDMSTGHAISA